MEIMSIVFVKGYFIRLQEKNKHDLHIVITTNLFLFLCHIIIDLILILMVYVYNFKEFTGETAIS